MRRTCVFGTIGSCSISLKVNDMSANEKHFCACPEVAVATDRRSALLKTAKWNNGDLIRIRFLGGDLAMQDRVEKVAKELATLAKLNFNFVEKAPSEIRVAFERGNGSWSYLGTQCKEILEPQPTMNFGWLTPQSSEQELRSVVLHEFGHAIGLIHEHQNPQRGIDWNKPAVIADLSGPPNNWSPETIENNMFKKYDPRVVDATDLDPDSIMMYPIPRSWTHGGPEVGFNSELSEMDRNKIREAYRV